MGLVCQTCGERTRFVHFKALSCMRCGSRNVLNELCAVCDKPASAHPDSGHPFSPGTRYAPPPRETGAKLEDE